MAYRSSFIGGRDPYRHRASGGPAACLSGRLRGLPTRPTRAGVPMPARSRPAVASGLPRGPAHPRFRSLCRRHSTRRPQGRKLVVDPSAPDCLPVEVDRDAAAVAVDVDRGHQRAATDVNWGISSALAFCSASACGWHKNRLTTRRPWLPHTWIWQTVHAPTANIPQAHSGTSTRLPTASWYSYPHCSYEVWWWGRSPAAGAAGLMGT